MVHEQTSKEIAGLLHGRVQSRMVVLGHWIQDSLNRLKDYPPEVLKKLERANTVLRDLRDNELRTITRQLYPSIIRTGLPSALNSLADRFQTMFTVQVYVDDQVAEMESPVRPRLGESLRLAFYRVAEEALANVAKHSRASNVAVSVKISPPGQICLEIRDDGRGFSMEAADLGQGLVSMEDYVTALGCVLEASSTAGVGTTIRASVPLAAAV